MGRRWAGPVVVVLAATAGCGVPGDPATWAPRDSRAITPESTEIPVAVSGRACNSGREWDVHDPLIETTSETVTVTYRVDAPSGGGTCEGVPGTEARLELPSPLGDRVLVDGGCDEEQDAFSCERWSPNARR